MSVLPKVARYCLQHQDEPIIRVSLNSKSSKLFYCHECLDELDKDTQSKLVKFHDFVETLHKQLSESQVSESEGTVSDDVSEHAITKEEYTVKLQGFISNHKQTAEEEFNTLEAQALEVLKASREHAHSYLDGLRETFKNELNDYTEKTNLLPKGKGQNETKITKEELEKDLMKEESLEETEKKVRDILKKAQEREDVKSGKMEKALTDKKKGLETVLQNSEFVPKKQDNYYKEKMDILNSYLEALVFSVDDSTDVGAKNLNKKDKQVLSKVKQSLNELQNTLTEKNTVISENLKKIFAVSQVTSEEKCLLGANAREGESYFCKTCFEDFDEEIGPSYLLCEACKNTCHADHNVISHQRMNFSCRCSSVTDCCKFEETCINRYAIDDKVLLYGLEPGEAEFCHYCAKVCHKELETTKAGIHSRVCGCSLSHKDPYESNVVAPEENGSNF